jgi:hypothetical protein
MKIETKRKILWWVKRILNYCEYADKYPYIVTEQRKVLNFQSRQCYPKQEINILSEDQMKYFANMQLLSELEKHNVIRYTKEVADFTERPGDIVYTAILKVITP